MRYGFCFSFVLLSLATTLSAQPVIRSQGVVNAADFTSGLAPGTIVSIFGDRLAPRTAVASSFPLPTTLEGVSVSFLDGLNLVSAPLFFVSANQINALLPYSMPGTNQQVQVKTAQGSSSWFSITVSSRAPRLLTKTMSGSGEPILLHANVSWSLSNSRRNRARW